MKISIRTKAGKNKFGKEIRKYVECDVLDFLCRYRECLVVGKWTTQSVNNNNTQHDKRYSCMTRNYHGCPQDKENYIKGTPKHILEHLKKRHHENQKSI